LYLLVLHLAHASSLQTLRAFAFAATGNIDSAGHKRSAEREAAGEKASKRRRSQAHVALLKVARGALPRADLYKTLSGSLAPEAEAADLELFLLLHSATQNSEAVTLLDQLLAVMDGSA
jgi:hypothetical protein